MIPKESPMAQNHPHHHLLCIKFTKLLLLLIIPTAAGTTTIALLLWKSSSWNQDILSFASSSALLIVIDSIRRIIESPPLVYLVLNLVILSILLSSTFSFQFSNKRTARSSSVPLDAVHEVLDNDDETTWSRDSEIEAAAIGTDQTAGSLTRATEPITMRPPGSDHDEFTQRRRNHSLTETASLDDRNLNEPWHHHHHHHRLRETASFPDRNLKNVRRHHHQVLIKTASSLEETEIPLAVVGPEEEGGGGGGDSMDDTWNAIMKGKRPQLRKSDTWNGSSSPDRHDGSVGGGGGGGRMMMKKSETFKGGMRPRRRAATAEEEEEVDRRAEEFISKIRGEIWLQRKESDQRFLDMINRGL